MNTSAPIKFADDCTITVGLADEHVYLTSHPSQSLLMRPSTAREVATALLRRADECEERTKEARS